MRWAISTFKKQMKRERRAARSAAVPAVEYPDQRADRLVRERDEFRDRYVREPDMVEERKVPGHWVLLPESGGGPGQPMDRPAMAAFVKALPEEDREAIVAARLRYVPAKVETVVVERGRIVPRPPKDPILDWRNRSYISMRLADAAWDYREAHLDRLGVVTGKGLDAGPRSADPLTLQERHLLAEDRLRAYQAAVPARLRARWLDPIVLQYRTATGLAEELSRQTGQAITREAVMTLTKECLEMLAEVGKRK